MNKSHENRPSYMNLGSNNHSETLIVCLLDHLILDLILPRLPVKSLIRFKCVSKLWCSIISTPDFTKTRLRISSFTPQFIIFRVTDEAEEANGCYLLSYDEDNNMSDLSQLDFVFKDLYSFQCIGSCHGLICLVLLDQTSMLLKSLIVWNPATREYRSIAIRGVPEDRGTCWFGYVSSFDDYKIIFEGLESGGNDQDGWHWSRIYVFSFRTSEWEKIDCLDTLIPEDEYSYLMLVDDTLYSIQGVNSEGNLGPRSRFIGYNLVTRELKVFSNLSWVDGYYDVSYTIVKGCLALLCFTDQGIDTWILKRSSDWSSWQKIFSLNQYAWPLICHSEVGKCLVKVPKNGKWQLKVVDINEEVSNHTPRIIDLSGIFFTSAAYVESPISPFGLAKSCENENTNEVTNFEYDCVHTDEKVQRDILPRSFKANQH